MEFVDEHGNEVLNLGSFTLLPQHVVRLIMAREELRADEFTKFQVRHSTPPLAPAIHATHATHPDVPTMSPLPPTNTLYARGLEDTTRGPHAALQAIFCGPLSPMTTGKK